MCEMQNQTPPDATDLPPRAAPQEPSAQSKTVGDAQDLLVCRHLTKRYAQVKALDDVSISLPTGKIIGLLGPNGSGKTTFIKLAAGLLTPSSGELLVDGKPIGAETKRVVAYLPERNSIPERLRVSEAIALYQTFFDDFDADLARSMLASLGVGETFIIKNLSKGTKEKVQLVMVMSRRARLYLLDEPISGVDPAARDFIIRTILEKHAPTATVIISTHLITDIEDALDGFVIIKNGRVFSAGTPKGLLENTGKTLDQYFREVFKC